MSIPVKRSNELLKVLTEEEELKLQRMSFISDFKRNKLEEQAQRNWEHFYKRNGSNFFKDRL
jgi:methyltransferase-like protein 6